HRARRRGAERVGGMLQARRQLRHHPRMPARRRAAEGARRVLRSARWIHARGPPRASPAHDPYPPQPDGTSPVKKKIAIAIASILVLASISACTRHEAEAPKASAADKYDTSKMDFKPPKAVVTSERHT